MSENDEYAVLVERVVKAVGGSFAPAKESELAKLVELGLPESVLSFYRQHSPSNRDRMESMVVMLPAWQIPGLIENTDLAEALSRYGYVMFAETAGGDPYTFNLSKNGPAGSPQIELISHEVYPDKFSKVEDVERVALTVAADLKEFLKLVAEEEIEFVPDDAF